ncbi:hypothetical protein ABIE73_004677 [Bradyrhizobium yuanmingense]
MTVIGWFQIILYCAIVVALTKPLGWYMTRVFKRRAHLPVARPAADRGRHLLDLRHRREARAALADLHGRDAAVSCRRLPHHLRPHAAAGRAAVQSSRPIRGRRGSVLQHRDLLHHQYQLAELRRREHAFLSDPDGRPDAPEFPVSGHRHRARGCPDPRLCPRVDAHNRQLLGRCDPLHALHPAADLCRVHAVPGLAGHPANTWRLRRSDHARGRQADHRSRPRRLAGRDQDARDQWRRLLQCQCRSPLREPDRAVEFRADAVDLRARRGAHQRVRPHGRQPAPGLGDSRRDGRAVRRRRRRLLLG